LNLSESLSPTALFLSSAGTAPPAAIALMKKILLSKQQKQNHRFILINQFFCVLNFLFSLTKFFIFQRMHYIHSEKIFYNLYFS